MDSDTREERARSFGPVSEAYERSRPGYPEAVVHWLVGEEPRDVVELGAGTGKLTRSLVALGHRVTAVEPLPEMIAHLLVAAPGVIVVEGGAESIPLPDASADVVTAAQAFHWFDHNPALREIARVLRPGGWVALVWNTAAIAQCSARRSAHRCSTASSGSSTSMRSTAWSSCHM